MVVIDAQTVRGGRAGPTFHEAGGRTNGSKRTILVERLGLPIAARVDSRGIREECVCLARSRLRRLQARARLAECNGGGRDPGRVAAVVVEGDQQSNLLSLTSRNRNVMVGMARPPDRALEQRRWQRDEEDREGSGRGFATQ
jgi:hypothetical protein